MCGIVGELRARPDGPGDIGAMADTVAHRGPDGHGVWSDTHCALGHRRLAIIDLSDAGCQPMGDERTGVQVTYNGEIYNFLELRRELEAKGYQFRSGTDTEVLVHGYAEWGDALVRRLRGMFAFGVWDQRRRRLLLARDRVGKKPLCYAVIGQTLVFASEIQALLAHAGVSREADPAAIVDYLAWGYVPAPRSGFAAIRKLPPGTLLTVQVRDDALEFEERTYWTLDYEPKLGLSERDAGERLREILSEAVRIRLVSDVRLGAFLSGGIDSSIVVGLMAAESAERVRTFSIGFDEQDYNELAHARRVAQRWDTEHHEFVVRPDALAVLPMLVRHYGEPYADSSAVPTYYVANLTRQHVTVALNGDGGDESFAGYERYWGSVVAERLRPVSGALRAMGPLLRALPVESSRSSVGKFKRFLEAAGHPAARRYARWSSYFTPQQRERLAGPALRRAGGLGAPEHWMADLFDTVRDLQPLDQVLSVDVRSYLPFDLLVKVDIAAMASSLEARSPFLDHHVMEFAARLPTNLKLRGRNGKHLLRTAFADLLPRENVERPKMGFGVPVGRWLRGPLRALLEESLTAPDAHVRRYLQGAEIDRLVRDHVDGRADHTSRVWNLLMLERWHRELGATTAWAES